MTEQQYKELLQTLGINATKSNVQTKELLEAKLNEYLDRADAEAEQKASDVQDAMDYLEDLIVKMGGGIALAPEEIEETEEGSQNSFTDRTAGRKGAITYTSSSAVGSTTTGSGAQGGTTSAGTTSKPSHPWFYSTTGDKNVDDMFKLAESDLMQGDFRHATSVFDTILRTEMANAGAYMGKVLAKYNLQEPKDIATCYTQGLDVDADLKRAESCGNDKQKKFIQDALEERRKSRIYLDAERRMQKQMREQMDAKELQNIMKKFDELGDYRDASQKADFCRTMYNELIYKEAVDILEKGTDSNKLQEAYAIFRELGDYKDAENKANECFEVERKVGNCLVEKEIRRKKRMEEWNKEQQEEVRKERQEFEKDMKRYGSAEFGDWLNILKFSLFSIPNIIIIILLASQWDTNGFAIKLFVAMAILIFRNLGHVKKKVMFRKANFLETVVISGVSIGYGWFVAKVISNVLHLFF